MKGCYFSKEELENKIQEHYTGFSFDEAGTVEVKTSDSAGYVLDIQIGNQEFQGEEIKAILDLPSSCFTVQKNWRRKYVFCAGGRAMGWESASIRSSRCL